jgi:hypothetical protein
VTALIRFTDDRGVEWEVREVDAPAMPADRRPPRTSRHGRGEAPWLCFESATQRRRLDRYPPRWPAMSERELTALCREATPDPMLRPLPPWLAPWTRDLPDGWS